MDESPEAAKPATNTSMDESPEAAKPAANTSMDESPEAARSPEELRYRLAMLCLSINQSKVDQQVNNGVGVRVRLLQRAHILVNEAVARAGRGQAIAPTMDG